VYLFALQFNRFALDDGASWFSESTAGVLRDERAKRRGVTAGDGAYGPIDGIDHLRSVAPRRRFRR
jgi:hypothetical protein